MGGAASCGARGGGMTKFASLTRIGSALCQIRNSALVAVARSLTRRAFFIQFPAARACAHGDMRGLADRLPRAAQGGEAKAHPLRNIEFAGMSLKKHSPASCPASDGGAS